MPDTREDALVPAAPEYNPLYTYKNLDMFRGRLASSRSNKSPSLLALQALTHSKPEFAKRIFERAVMEPFMRLVLTEGPAPARLSDEATRRIEELRDRFLQEPTYVIGMFEAIFVIERIEPWAENTVRLISHGKTSLAQVRAGGFEAFAHRLEDNGCALAMMNLGNYVRERDYRIMLALVSAIDGRSEEEQALRILDDLPILKGYWDEFGDGTTESIVGPDGAKRIVSWIMGHIEF